MAAIYVIVQIKVNNPDNWSEYRARLRLVLERYKARMLACGGPVTVLDGMFDGRDVAILEFPSIEAALTFRGTADFAELKNIRHRSGTADIWAVSGA